MTIVEQLRALAAQLTEEGNTGQAGLIRDAAEEIVYLRSVVGAASRGPSYADIAKDARHDLPVSERTDG